MCVACHSEIDRNYPSTLMLGKDRSACGDCHMSPEDADISWVQDMGISVRLAVRAKGKESEAATLQVEALAVEALRARGFRLVSEGEADLALTLVLTIRTLRDDRFLPQGTPVRAAVIDATVVTPGEETAPCIRRLGASKPEWALTEKEAVERAVGDAWGVLSSHVLDALGSH